MISHPLLNEHYGLFKKKDWQGIIDLLTDKTIEEIKDNNTKAELYYTRGNAYVQLGKYQKSIKDYDKAIGLRKEVVKSTSKWATSLAGIYYHRGNAYGQQGKYQKSIKDYDKAIKIVDKVTEDNLNFFHMLIPALTDTYNNRGIAYGKLKQYEEAIKDYTQAIDILTKEIEDNPQKASKLNPELTNAYYNRGIAYDEQDKYEKAIKDYIEVININKDQEYIKKKLLNRIIIRGYGSFSEKINAIKSKLEYKEIKSLYHYSSKEAIDGIVFAKDERYFAFTEANFLNDPTEGNFLLDIINISPLEIKKDAKKPFVACFATLGDDLNQWRLYGNDGNGANIGIEANKYLESLKDKLKINDDDLNQWRLDGNGANVGIEANKYPEEINKNIQDKNKDNTAVSKQIEDLSWAHICYVDKENNKFYINGKKQPDSETKDDKTISKLLEDLNGCVKNILKNTTPDKAPQNIEDKDIEEEIEQNLKDIDFEDYVKEVVTEKLETISCLFKHIAYKDEQEVRLVVPFAMIPNDKLNLAGYKVKWQAPAIPFDAIESIKFGPNQNQDFKTYLLYKKEQTKEDNNCKDIGISHSELPYKSKNT